MTCVRVHARVAVYSPTLYGTPTWV